jgi:hypothetical protein
MHADEARVNDQRTAQRDLQYSKMPASAGSWVGRVLENSPKGVLCTEGILTTETQPQCVQTCEYLGGNPLDGIDLVQGLDKHVIKYAVPIEIAGLWAEFSEGLDSKSPIYWENGDLNLRGCLECYLWKSRAFGVELYRDS